MMRIGIVGLPNAGKSTLFNALTQAGAQVASYPFTTIDPNVGIVPVPDPRLDRIASIVKPEKVTPATVEFVDIAGLVKGASRGEGLGNRFLGHIREVDAIAHVIRCFTNPDVPHVSGNLNPVLDAEIVETELILADIETVKKRRDKAAKMQKSGDRHYQEETILMDRLKGELEGGKPAKLIPLSDEEKACIQSLFLLTMKPVVYVANIGENDLKDSAAYLRVLTEWIQSRGENAPVVAISARLESELADLTPDEAQEYLQELGMESSGLKKLVIAAYSALDLITFYTTKGTETRAWTLRRGETAFEAAGKIHTDMQRGFIKAEVIRYEDLVSAGSFAEAREKGLLRQEGREYPVQDGDVILFRFSQPPRTEVRGLR